jgi:cytochrome c peroxidase
MDMRRASSNAAQVDSPPESPAEMSAEPGESYIEASTYSSPAQAVATFRPEYCEGRNGDKRATVIDRS